MHSKWSHSANIKLCSTLWWTKYNAIFTHLHIFKKSLCIWMFNRFSKHVRILFTPQNLKGSHVVAFLETQTRIEMDFCMKIFANSALASRHGQAINWGWSRDHFQFNLYGSDKRWRHWICNLIQHFYCDFIITSNLERWMIRHRIQEICWNFALIMSSTCLIHALIASDEVI